LIPLYRKTYSYTSSGYTSAGPGDRVSITWKKPCNVAGLKWTVGASTHEAKLGYNAGPVYSSDVEYGCDQFNSKTSFFSNCDLHKVNSAMSFGSRNGLSVGISLFASWLARGIRTPNNKAFAQSSDGQFTIENIALSTEYKINNQTQTALTVDENGKKASMLVIYEHSPEQSFAIRADAPTDGSANGRGISVAHQFLISPYSYLKLKGHFPSGQISVAHEAKLASPRLTAGLSATFDTKKSVNTVSKWGLALNWNY